MTIPAKKTDKMVITELFLGEELKAFLQREYQPRTVTTLALLLSEKTGQKINRSTVWKWLKFYKIRTKRWR